MKWLNIQLFDDQTYLFYVRTQCVPHSEHYEALLMLRKAKFAFFPPKSTQNT
jgi:hypothetical protein